MKRFRLSGSKRVIEISPKRLEKNIGSAQLKIVALTKFLPVSGPAQLIVVALTAFLSVSVPAQDSLQDAMNCTGEWAGNILCKERQLAFDTRSQVEIYYEKLSKITNPPWLSGDLEAAKALYDEGMTLYQDQYFGDAAKKFQPALALMEELDTAFESLLENLKQEAASDLDKERFESATEKYQQILEWIPDSTEAGSGLENAQRGLEFQTIVMDANRLFNAGEVDAANQRIMEIPAGWSTKDLRQLRQNIAAFKRDSRFRELMTRGYSLMDAERWEDAGKVFMQALVESPDSTIAKEVLQEVRNQLKDQNLESLASDLAIYAGEEDWISALNVVNQIHKLTPDDKDLEEEIDLLEERIDIELRVDEHLVDVKQLPTNSKRMAVKTLLETADHERFGVRIAGKRSRLQHYFDEISTPVKVTLLSDGKTNVMIRPGSGIGQFKEIELNILPGKYVIRGRRVGYREELHQLTLLPGSDSPVIRIECDEQF